MLRRFFVDRKFPVLFAAGGVIVALLALVVWQVILPDEMPGEENLLPPIKLEYCGVELEELCVLSFGRDGDGSTIVNLFVPKGNLPAFYLMVNRVTGESRYECETSGEVPTSVYCIGEPLNLDERIEISIVSKTDDHLLAKGRFTLTAVLISAGDGQPPSAQNTISPSPEVFTSETDPGLPGNTATPTPTPTATSKPSYPNYP